MRTAMVTGGAGGIGVSVVRRLTDAGISVVMIDRNRDALDAATERFGSADNLDSFPADVTSPEAVQAAIDYTVSRFASLDILINIAGGSGRHRVREVDAIELEVWDQVMDLNLRSAFLCCRAALPHMRARRWGRIVNFSSILARGENGPLTTVAGRLPYATAKAALLGFTAQLAKDVAELGITVNALVPGLILGEPGTRIRDRFDALGDAEREAMVSRYPMGRAGTGADVAGAVAYLVSDDGAYVSGTTITVDGAFT